MRSLLFIPGDDEKKLGKGTTSGADVLILDLEDSVALSRKEIAREMVARYIRANHGKDGPRLFVRINALDTGISDTDLDAIMPAGPHGIMLPKACGGRDVTHLGAKLAVREAENGLGDGATRILPIATETARAIFQLGTYEGSSQRLCGLTWGAEDLAADIGAETNRMPDGSYSSPFMLARTMCLFGASAAGVVAVDTVYPNFRDESGFETEAEQARRDGFSAKMAIHPAQIAIINRIFTPTPEAVEEAQAIIAAFASAPQAGVIAINGKMFDRPHLRQAMRILAQIKSAERS